MGGSITQTGWSTTRLEAHFRSTQALHAAPMRSPALADRPLQVFCSGIRLLARLVTPMSSILRRYIPGYIFKMIFMYPKRSPSTQGCDGRLKHLEPRRRIDSVTSIPAFP